MPDPRFVLARLAIVVAVLMLVGGLGYDQVGDDDDPTADRGSKQRAGERRDGDREQSGSRGSARQPAPPAGAKLGVVARVVDGDTVELEERGSTRLIGVDTPEVYGGVECYGREASSYAKRLMPPGTRVRYEIGVEPRDRYGRLLAYVWLAERDRFVNGLLVEGGFATPLTIPPNVEYADLFVALSRGARDDGTGLWARGACGPGERRQ